MSMSQMLLQWFRPQAKPAPVRRSRPKRHHRPIDDRYDELVRTMLDRYGLRVRKWRTSMSGVAWEVHYRDGSVSRLIEAPRPRGPMSAAVFLHEVGHHAIGLRTYAPRCLEEYHAWAWSLRAMEENGFNVTDRVRRRMAESLAYAVHKARRRGLKRLPSELEPFTPERV
ncbi:MAG: hypothetical protein AAGH64_10040, partial [Planctomycetota bacterium]